MMRKLCVLDVGHEGNPWREAVEAAARVFRSFYLLAAHRMCRGLCAKTGRKPACTGVGYTI